MTVGKTPYQIQCRAEFDGMLAKRNEAKHARRPMVPLGEPVKVLPIVPVADRMAEIHAAADARMAADLVYATTRAELDAQLADILLDPLPDIRTND